MGQSGKYKYVIEPLSSLAQSMWSENVLLLNIQPIHSREKTDLSEVLRPLLLYVFVVSST